MLFTDPASLPILIFLHIAAFTDARMHRIPNLLTLAALFPGGFVLGAHYLYRLLGLFLILFPLFHLRLLGAGDIKLLSVVFAWCGVDRFLLFFFFSLIAASIPSLVLFLRGRRRAAIPMGPFFLFGWICSSAYPFAS